MPALNPNPFTAIANAAQAYAEDYAPRWVPLTRQIKIGAYLHQTTLDLRWSAEVFFAIPYQPGQRRRQRRSICAFGTSQKAAVKALLRYLEDPAPDSVIVSSMPQPRTRPC